MKNVNYNLLKLLHGCLDDEWRIEKHYLADAKGACSSCERLLKEMREGLAKQTEALKAELKKHMGAGLD